jgi:hypothetical protein
MPSHRTGTVRVSSRTAGELLGIASSAAVSAVTTATTKSASMTRARQAMFHEARLGGLTHGPRTGVGRVHPRWPPTTASGAHGDLPGSPVCADPA